MLKQFFFKPSIIIKAFGIDIVVYIYLYVCIVAWLHFFWKCGVGQCGWGKVSTGHKKNLSHFYISKKFWKPCQTFGWLVLTVWSRADWLVFFKVSRTFLKYENGSKNFYELLRSILTYTELPHIFEKKVIMLIGM